MAAKWSFFVLVTILVQSVTTKLSVQNRNIMQDLINYKSYNNRPKEAHSESETIYYSPYREVFQDNDAHKNSTKEDILAKLNDVASAFTRQKRADPTFRGNPKSRQEIWHRNFNFSTAVYDQTSSLIALLVKLITQHMNACTPVILYDEHVEKSEGLILQRLFMEFPTAFMHAKINKNYSLNVPGILVSKDSKCRSYILFLADATQTRKVVGSQIDNKVIVIPRSTQWKLQEFLSSSSSRDIINLLVIGESYSAVQTKEKPYVLYTHHLYTDGLGSNKPIILTTWMNGKLSRPHVDIFPVKLTKGFSGHRFSVAAANQPPFVFKTLSTDGVGNLNIKWDGLEYRLLQTLSKMMNFTFDVSEPRSVNLYGAGDAVGMEIIKKQYDIGIGGMYITSERNIGMEMSVSHSSDCAAFISLASRALPRYRAIMGPFQWEVWLCLTLVYLLAIIPLAYSDSLSIRYLIDRPQEIENMFWYVFGTFTNSLTFGGELSWSNSKKTSTRMLIGWYWVFTIIITACYTGSIIAFVTLPVFPETIDSIDQLNSGFFRVGTLDRGGWERWFLNSTQTKTAKLLKNMEFVVNIEEGLSNVTNAFFWQYAFIGSKSQLEYIIQNNYTNAKMSKSSALHISNECFALFGVSLAFQEHSVYRPKINEAILALQQSGLVAKILNDVKWDMLRSSNGRLMQISGGKTMKISAQTERGLTLADTEGMFLLLGIGFLIAGGVLISEWVGGCSNKCRQILKNRREDREEAVHRLAENVAEHFKDTSSNGSRFSFNISRKESVKTYEIDIETKSDTFSLEVPADDNLETSSNDNKSASDCVSEMNKFVLQDLYNGPKRRHSAIVMVNGKMMSDDHAQSYLFATKSLSEKNFEKRGSGISDISEMFKYLEDEEGGPGVQSGIEKQIFEVEINHETDDSAVKADEVDIDASFGEKVLHLQI